MRTLVPKRNSFEPYCVALVVVPGSNRPSKRTQFERVFVLADEVAFGMIRSRMNEESTLHLIVIRGTAAGASLRLDGTWRRVGRARDADLPIPDEHVSRRHLEVMASSDGMMLRTVEGASAALLNGRPVRTAVVRPGAQVFVGQTVLAVVQQSSARPVETPRSLATDALTVMSGTSRGAHDMVSMMALVEAVDAAGDAGSLSSIVGQWAREHAAVRETSLRFADETDRDYDLNDAVARPRDLHVQTLAATRSRLLVPAHASSLAWLVFDVDEPAEAIDEDRRRLLFIAGRVFGFGLARVTAANAVASDRDFFRRLAIGSARAFFGTSAHAAAVRARIAELAHGDAPFLVRGEPGAGATFAARLVHDASSRAREPFHVVRCAGELPERIEAMLFGDATATASGASALERAGRGTLLLVDIDSLPTCVQSCIANALATQRVSRAGSDTVLPLRARLGAVVHGDVDDSLGLRPLESSLASALEPSTLDVLPLRKRPEDLLLLAQQALADVTTARGHDAREFSSAAAEAIRAYAWPGNVHELRNAIEHAVLLGEGKLVREEDLAPAIRRPSSAANGAESVKLPAPLAFLERQAIDAAVRETNGNLTRAAAILGVGRTTLYRKLEAAGVRRTDAETDL